MELSRNYIDRINKLGSKRQAFLLIVDFQAMKPLLLTTEELKERGVLFSFEEHTNQLNSDLIKDFYFRKYPMTFEKYKAAFDKVMFHIKRGDTFLLNLTFPTKIDTNLNLKEIYHYSRAKYRLMIPDEFVVFSPEPFVNISDNIISSFPMKGTMDGGVPDAKNKLLSDIKEKAEHFTIVDLIRNDLSSVAKNVSVEKFRYIEEIQTHEKVLLQSSSAISGRLQKNWQRSLGNMMAKLLPAGSISGAPKKKTVEIIIEAEAYNRGYFTGVMAYFDGENLQSAVMIRYIEKTPDGLFFKSGGGITHFSDAKSEYEEMIQKVYVPII